MLNTIQKLIDETPNNTTRRFLCPFCMKAYTFNITKANSVIKYHCYSNSCNGSSGYFKTIPDTEELKVMINKDKELIKPVFKEPAYFLSGLAHSDVFKYIQEHNGMRAYEDCNYHVAYDKAEHRLVYLLYENNEVVGALGRTLYKYYNPKTKIYENSKIMPFIVGRYNTIIRAVIVEDCASACAVNDDKMLAGFALLGTTFKNEYIPYLKKYKTIWIALDPDARKTALEIKNSLTYVHNDVRILNIPKDIKNMSKNEWIEFRINHIYGV